MVQWRQVIKIKMNLFTFIQIMTTSDMNDTRLKDLQYHEFQLDCDILVGLVTTSDLN